MTHSPPGAEVLTGPGARGVLAAALEADGARLHGWAVRSVHQRGTSSVAVVYEVDLSDRGGQRRERLYVGHVTTRPVPPGAISLAVAGARIHVWRFPHDPYLPGLPAAVTPGRTARLLQRLGLDDEPDPAIRTRSYRPTRRAVVELRAAAGRPPVAYVKLLGGRDRRQVRRRTRRLVTVHERLGRTLPVPAVLEHDTDQGRAVLAALPGTSLRHVLRTGGDLPDPAELRDLLARLHELADLPDGADPDAYADVARHVDRLRRALPERREDLEHAATAAASVGGPRGTVHGDLHDGQLLVTGGTVTGVLDVDGAGTGFIAHDLGRLLAHTEASALAVPDAADRITAYVADLEEALADLVPRGDLVAAAAGAWIGLATGPLRVASASWRSETGARIDRARAWADRIH